MMKVNFYLAEDVAEKTVSQVSCEPRIDDLLNIDFYFKEGGTFWFVCSEAEIKDLIKTLKKGLEMLDMHRKNPVQVQALE